MLTCLPLTHLLLSPSLEGPRVSHFSLPTATRGLSHLPCPVLTGHPALQLASLSEHTGSLTCGSDPQRVPSCNLRVKAGSWPPAPAAAGFPQPCPILSWPFPLLPRPHQPCYFSNMPFALEQPPQQPLAWLLGVCVHTPASPGQRASDTTACRSPPSSQRAWQRLPRAHLCFRVPVSWLAAAPARASQNASLAGVQGKALSRSAQ